MDISKIKSLLIKHEGFRAKPYRCTAGKLTIGMGRNLDDKGITHAEADYMLINDITECVTDLEKIFTDFDELPENVQLVMTDMRFNLGATGFRSFKNMITAVKNRDWKAVVKSMKASNWYNQVGNRSKKLVKMIESI